MNAQTSSPIEPERREEHWIIRPIPLQTVVPTEDMRRESPFGFEVWTMLLGILHVTMSIGFFGSFLATTPAIAVLVTGLLLIGCQFALYRWAALLNTILLWAAAGGIAFVLFSISGAHEIAAEVAQIFFGMLLIAAAGAAILQTRMYRRYYSRLKPPKQAKIG